MSERVINGQLPDGPWRVLTTESIEQLDQKLAEALELRFAEITLVIENGKFRWIRGPSPSEPVRCE